MGIGITPEIEDWFENNNLSKVANYTIVQDLEREIRNNNGECEGKLLLLKKTQLKRKKLQWFDSFTDK